MRISFRSVVTILLLVSRAVPTNALFASLFSNSLCGIPLLSFILNIFGLCQNDAGSPLERGNEIPNYSRSNVNLDGDIFHDIILGTKNRSGCGELLVWLSEDFCPTTADSCETALIDERPDGAKNFPTPSAIVTTTECDPLFGSYMVALDDSNELFVPSGEGETGWTLDAKPGSGSLTWGDLIILSSSSPLEIGALATKVETSPLLLPAVQAARERADGSSQCEPCCGPDYCCCTAGDGPGPLIPDCIIWDIDPGGS